MRKRIISGLILIFSLYLIVSLSRGIIDLFQKEKIIEREEEGLEELRVETEKLREEYEYVQSEEFVEKEAREKLGLAKEGETVVILPEDFEEMVEASRKEVESDEVPNWKKWVGLFGF